MSSDIDIASNALQMIGDSPINSFDDPGAGARVMKAIYPDIYEALLSGNYWTFAKKKVQLNKLSQTPLNDFQYAYQIPVDSVRVLKVNPRGFYKIYRDLIYSNTDGLAIDYIFKPAESQLPADFILALTYKLASDAAIPVTESVSKAEYYEGKHLTQLVKAQATDAQGNPQTPIVDQPFTDVRNGGTNGFT